MKILILLLFSLLLFSCDTVNSNDSDVEIITGNLKDLAVYKTLNSGRVVIDDFLFKTTKTSDMYYIIVELSIIYDNYTEKTPISWDKCRYYTTKYIQYLILDYDDILYSERLKDKASIRLWVEQKEKEAPSVSDKE